MEDYSNDSSDPEISDDNFDFVLNSRPRSHTRARHPPPERIHQLWQIFIERIDPLTKVLHVPTLQPAIEKAASNIESIPRSFEALMFAIYAAAIMSLNDEECKQKFGEPRKTLLSLYITATKGALLRARFIGTTSLVVLQALILYLHSVRDVYEPRTLWCLTGVAVRVAHGMGLERDGTFLGLSPFETEIRRRIWWLLKTHDSRTAELCGLHKFRDLDWGPESTKRPTNVNDDQLYPGMPSLSAESEALTDIAFVAVRYELFHLATARVTKFRQQGKHSSQWDRDLASGDGQITMDESSKEVERLLEDKYLRYCDPSQPLHLITMLMARSAINTIRFLTHHPRRWASILQTPLSERQWVWEVSIKLLEQHIMLQSNSILKPFAWHAAFVMSWHAFIHVLDTLRSNPRVADAEKAWELISHTYDNNPAMIFDTRKPIHLAVGRLCLEAYSARTASLQRKGNTCMDPPTPGFISQLRQQRQLVTAKRQAQIVKSSRADQSVPRGQIRVGPEKEPSAAAGVVHSSNTSESMYSHQTALPQHELGFGRASIGTSDGDSFWFDNGFDEGHIDKFNDVMEMDLDFMRSADDTVGSNAFQPVPWEQWDTWLAESNAMLPVSSTEDLGAH